MAGTAFSTSSWAGYDEATATNPSAALTDFPLLIDISTFSSTWKSNIQSDGADIRCTKGDDTEIPFDLIDFAYNAGAPTGKIRCKWSGSLASSGTQNVRVWAGYLGGTATAYGDTETYGADNAYHSGTLDYWPLSGDLNSRTVNANNGTGQGGIGAGDVTGKVTQATNFDGSGDYITIASGGVPSEYQVQTLTVMCWVKSAQTNNFNGIYRHVGDQSPLEQIILSELSTGSQMSFRAKGATTVVAASGGDYTASSAFHHYAGTADSASAVEIFEDGTSVTSTATAAGTIGYDTDGFIELGRFTNLWGSTGGSSSIEEVIVYNDVRSDEWIAEEYAQSNSQSTFWGTWAWTFATFVGSGVLDGNALSDASLVR